MSDSFSDMPVDYAPSISRRRVVWGNLLKNVAAAVGGLAVLGGLVAVGYSEAEKSRIMEAPLLPYVVPADIGENDFVRRAARSEGLDSWFSASVIYGDVVGALNENVFGYGAREIVLHSGTRLILPDVNRNGRVGPETTPSPKDL